jgi:outer membrane protein assembly factor BamB
MFLISAITVSLFALQVANAQGSGEIASYAYIAAAPNPVGVGQTAYITLWVDVALPNALVTNDVRRKNYTLTITKPDGTTETFSWPIIDDTTGIAFKPYTPVEVGTYTLKFDYGGQVYTWDDDPSQISRYGGILWKGYRFLPATKTTTLTVQEEQLPAPIGSYPLPTEYWSRPIEGQNTYWYKLASHWLGGNYFGAFQMTSSYNLWQKSGIGPSSPHIMWTKPIEFGGVVGGETSISGETYYSGGSYEGRFVNTIIMHGRLYYQLPLGHSGSGGGYACVDLRTGEEIWSSNVLGSITTAAPSKGQLYSFNTENQHGVGGGILWQVVGTTWTAYDPFSGMWMYNFTSVPSGTEVYTDKGEIVRYVLNYPRRWLALWNNTAAVNNTASAALYDGTNRWRPNGKTINMSAAYSWNVSIPDLPGLSSPVIHAVLPGDVILGTSSAISPTVGRARVMPNPYTVWAISDKPLARGQLLWIKNYSAPAGNITRHLGPVDPVNRVWTMTDGETQQWLGYSLEDGSLLWGPTTTKVRDLQFFGSGEGMGQRAVTAYGNIYVQGFGGELFCYSTKDGTLLWKYNNTDSGLETPWGLRPIFVAAVADGKVYAFNNEHSPNSPLYKGNKIYCLNASTGEEIYAMMGWAGQSGGTGASMSVLAEGFLVYYSYYDNQIYCVGKGSSAVTVTAPDASVELGKSLVVRGTVMDTSAGTKQTQIAVRFPSGVPAVSDASMSAWMEYVYMQKPRPTDIIGVEVTLSVLDSNNNYRDIGKATTNSDGFFTFNWKPDIEGQYTVYASFAGSESYWPSHAVSSFAVDPAPPAPAEPEPEPPSMTDTYVLGSTIAIIIAIAVGFAVAIVLLRKRP